MKFFSTLVLSGLFCNISFGQQSNTMKINSQQQNANLLGYLYESFTDGKVISPDGTYGKAKLNFNFLTNEMLFINPQNDTLKLAKPEATAMVTIATDTFCFYKNTFLKKITHYKNGPHLFQKQNMRLADNEKKGGYGGYSSVSSDASGSTFDAGGIITRASEDKNLVFKRNNEIFLSDNKGSFLPMKQASFQKVFPQWKNKLKAFVEEQAISFNKEQDVLSVADYLHQLNSAEPAEPGNK